MKLRRVRILVGALGAKLNLGFGRLLDRFLLVLQLNTGGRQLRLSAGYGGRGINDFATNFQTCFFCFQLLLDRVDTRLRFSLEPILLGDKFFSGDISLEFSFDQCSF